MVKTLRTYTIGKCYPIYNKKEKCIKEDCDKLQDYQYYLYIEGSSKNITLNCCKEHLYFYDKEIRKMYFSGKSKWLLQLLGKLMYYN